MNRAKTQSVWETYADREGQDQLIQNSLSVYESFDTVENIGGG